MNSAHLKAPRVAVLGAGLTGLTAAWQLAQSGFTPVVFEKSARTGGAIGAMHSDGWLHELGPNSMLEGSPGMTAFIDAIGLGSRRLYAASTAKKRFIVRAGSLVPMPSSPISFITTRLFSTRAKLALLGEPWRSKGPSDADETVAEFVLRRLGREFLDYAINPFVGGVYAGDPTRLSVRHAFPKLHALERDHGSLIRGALKQRNTHGGPKGRMFSFPNGLAEVPNALTKSLGDAVRLQTQIEAICRTADGWEVQGVTRNRCWTEHFDAVLCALPADALASLVVQGTTRPTHLAALREIEQPPVASVFTGYRRSDVRHPLDGFGALVPEVEAGSMLGTLFSSTLFPGRAPEGYVALTSFLGGMRQPELASLDDEEILQVVHTDLRRLIGVRAAPVFTHIKRWPRGIPQYEVGYQRFKDVISDAETSGPGLFIGGNARDGISLANCIESGRRLAEAARSYLEELSHNPLQSERMGTLIFAHPH